ncbi:rCG60990 [Rattus norvegicus]|uniref:RCG60990 n=1 Tax=Rattus norvegicus TaxID=10116 RepID=A6JKX5_RAT|nr:rCG60990 [Rattus norvegicus]
MCKPRASQSFSTIVSVGHSCRPKPLKHKHETNKFHWSTQAFI